ncbi:hypothetical protein IWZ01DRAFT_481982 [Phyllosticta capitalensis]
MQRLSSAFYSLDNLVAKVTDNTTTRDTSNRKSAIFSRPSELEPDGKIRRLSLPPESHPAPTRRNSAVQSILRRTKSKDVVNRFSAYLGRPRSRPNPQRTRSRPVSECTISSPCDFRQGSSAWVSCSESLAQTSLRSDSSGSGDIPTYGQTKFDKHKSATPFTAYPILVTVHCPSSDESVGRVTTNKYRDQPDQRAIRHGGTVMCRFKPTCTTIGIDLTPGLRSRGNISLFDTDVLCQASSRRPNMIESSTLTCWIPNFGSMDDPEEEGVPLGGLT